MSSNEERGGDANDDECGICLDVLSNPVTLPCRHMFCKGCLEGWRSKYSVEEHRTRSCPLCRKKLPPSRELLNQLESMHGTIEVLEDRGDVRSGSYFALKRAARDLEEAIGGCDEKIIGGEDEEECVDIPLELWRDADIGKILAWLGYPNVDKSRLKGECATIMNISLLHIAMNIGEKRFLSILLQCGANTEQTNSVGRTPLGFTIDLLCGAPVTESGKVVIELASLLLEWGAEKSSASDSNEQLVTRARKYRHRDLANMLESELGGRRCEIHDMQDNRHLNGQTCVVREYIPGRNRYVVTLETNGRSFSVAAQNLERRDRTPDDCGYYVQYKRGQFARRVFASKEELQAFAASLAGRTEVPKLPDAEAEARAEEAAASLLAELDLEEENRNVANINAGKRKSGKKNAKKQRGRRK